MKTLFVIMIAFCSVSAFAGEAINKVSGDRLIISVDRVASTATITLKESTTVSQKTVSLASFEKEKAIGVGLVKTRASLTDSCGPCGPANGNPQILYRLSYELFAETKAEFNHVWVGYFIPGYNVIMIATNLIETVALPVNLTRKMLRNSYVRRDLKLINALLNSDESIEIGSKQFRRLFFYL